MDKRGTTNLVIETHGLTKYYGKARGILDVDLEIAGGEIFGFIGPNGAGKSTTIRTLLGLIFPTRGSGQIFGMDIVSESKAIKQQVGFIPSDVNYYSRMTAAELLTFSARFFGIRDTLRIRELAVIFDLDLRRRFCDLSLGNRKKVSIIQALLHKPGLLILDEPTSGLDPLMQNHFFDLLSQENERGTTIFFSSHTLSEIQKLCGRVAIIKEGQLIRVEDVRDLRKRQLKKVKVEFAQTVPLKRLNLPGVTALVLDGRTAEFFYAGEINPLLSFLGGFRLQNLILTEPELEEIFLHYYTHSEAEAGEA